MKPDPLKRSSVTQLVKWSGQGARNTQDEGEGFQKNRGDTLKYLPKVESKVTVVKWDTQPRESEQAFGTQTSQGRIYTAARTQGEFKSVYPC